MSRIMKRKSHLGHSFGCKKIEETKSEASNRKSLCIILSSRLSKTWKFVLNTMSIIIVLVAKKSYCVC